MTRIIRNPVEWGWAQLASAAQSLGAGYRSLHHIQETIHAPAPALRRIQVADVTAALSAGWQDFGAVRSDVVFLCLAYPLLGLLLGLVAAGTDFLPLLFPLASGFALVGPVAAVGLYEMSLRREKGLPVSWAHVFDVLRTPAIGAIAILALILGLVFVGWLAAAHLIYLKTLGPAAPATLASFVQDVFFTEAGHRLILIGVGVGFLFALLSMSIGMISFPLLVDRDVGLDTAIGASVRAVWMNPLPMAVWGLIVAGALVLGSLPLFLGLAVAVPVLGHATWHLYRRLVDNPPRSGHPSD